VEDNPSAASERVQPEVVDQGAARHGDGGDGSKAQEQVSRPTKLIRIASMVRNMLEEVRRAPIDDSGRRALREIHERSIHELEDVLSPDLKEELCDVVLPFQGDAPSESEIRLAQAQLVGWLEGLFQGIQATLFTQQMAAQGQMEEMRRRALESGQPPPPGAQQPAPPGSGYL
jgi:proteasome activator-like protein